MNEEEIEELKGIERLRRRFPNSMPNFLEGGNWDRLLWSEDKDKRRLWSYGENLWSW